MISAKIIRDSISPEKKRLTTFEVEFPRFILAEFNTHRVLSRNSASSRAIPTEKIIERVQRDPFVPDFNKRVKGMGVGAALNPEDARDARETWLEAAYRAVKQAEILVELDCDKSRVNRLLEPFMWHTAIVTATEWSNFLALRTDRGAQPEFRLLALLMQECLEVFEPYSLPWGEWHLPYINATEYSEFEDPEIAKKVSVGRCARVSYLTHDGVRDHQADIDLHDRLMTNGHMSPFEHVARPINTGKGDLYSPFLDFTNRSGNFLGWHQYRKDIPNEADFSEVKKLVEMT